MIKLYLNTITDDWFLEDGSMPADDSPSCPYNTHETIGIQCVTSNDSEDTEGVEPETDWEKDTQFAKLQGVSALLSCDNNYLRHLLGTLDVAVQSGPTPSEVVATISSVTVANCPDAGTLRLFDAAGNFEVLEYTYRELSGTTVTFTLASGQILENGYSSGSSIDCGEGLYAQTALDAENSDPATGYFQFNFYTYSKKLRAKVDYNDTRFVDDVKGLELLVYTTDADTGEVRIRAIHLCQTFSIPVPMAMPPAIGVASEETVNQLAVTVASMLSYGFALQFSEDGENWHETQDSGDIYFHFRSKSGGGSWSDAILIPKGENGQDGADGANGADGASAYDIWIAAGNTGTEADFLASLKGADGANGADGASAYDIWIAAGNTGTEADFLASLKGADGANGADGASAYDIWIAAGNTGTEADFLASLKGADGVNGTDGQDGGSADIDIDTAIDASSTNPVTNAAIAAALNAKQDALPSGTTGHYLRKTASGVEWAVVQGSSVAPNYDPLYDSRVVSPIEIEGLRDTLRSLIEEMPHLCPKTITITHKLGNEDPPAYPASKTDPDTGLQLGHTYQLTLWCGNGNYDGYGHYTGGGSSWPDAGSDAYRTATKLILPSTNGKYAGEYRKDETTGLYRSFNAETGQFGDYYIYHWPEGVVSSAMSGIYVSDEPNGEPYGGAPYGGAPYSPLRGTYTSPPPTEADAAAIIEEAWEWLLETYGQTYTEPVPPDPDNDGVTIGMVYWATVLDITPCVAGTCPLESRIAALENA